MEVIKIMEILFLLLYENISINSYVLIELKKFENKNKEEYTSGTLIKSLFNQYYGLINVGNPQQKTEVQISPNYMGLIMKENICLTSNFYNKEKSLSLKELYFTNLNQTIEINETIEFPLINSNNNELSYNNIENYNFIYYKSNISNLEIERKSCLILGLQLICELGTLICNNIPGYLKRAGITNSSNFFFIFNDDKIKNEIGGYNASVLIGENPHNYKKNKFHENHYIQSHVSFWKAELSWTLRFKNYYNFNGEKIIFYYNKKEDLIHGIFMFDLDTIIGTEDYYQSIKTNYFDKYKKQCLIETVDSRYTVISCEKNFNENKFPTLYFFNMDYNFTFELTYKDLFEVRGNRKYFLIVFDSNSNYPWKFGKLFLQKYILNFEYDSKSIGFYTDLKYESISNDDEDDEDSHNYYWLILILILVITGIGCFFLSKLIYDKNRKKRANELDDDYDYTQKNNEENLANDFNENKLGIGQ